MLATSDYLNRPCRSLADVLKARAACAKVGGADRFAGDTGRVGCAPGAIRASRRPRDLDDNLAREPRVAARA